MGMKLRVQRYGIPNLTLAHAEPPLFTSFVRPHCRGLKMQKPAEAGFVREEGLEPSHPYGH